jgi:hypothetical protein
MYKIFSDEASLNTDRLILKLMLIITAASLIFPLVTILFDIYQYRVWWAYEPDVDISSNIAEKSLSRKHKRFIPYILTERFRTNATGNRKCKNGNTCQKTELEHVVMFHASDHEPQPRWSAEHPVYIGFHRTTPQAAIEIAKSEFRGSARGMLGPGAYFARSTKATLSKIGKPEQTGAWFVAEIRMGEVFQVEEHSIRSFTKNTHFDHDLQRYVVNGNWHGNYDTCYFNHHVPSRDEFCIKDPAVQILRWVVVIETPHDKKIAAYGLNEELYARACGCC